MEAVKALQELTKVESQVMSDTQTRRRLPRDHDESSTDSPLLRLAYIASESACRYCLRGVALSPQDHVAVARFEFEQSPGATVERRPRDAHGYAVAMYGPSAPDRRRELHGSGPLETTARFKIRRLLVNHRYPPDKQGAGISLVAVEAGRIADEVVG